jgi:hypothetical protein
MRRCRRRRRNGDIDGRRMKAVVEARGDFQ